MKYIRLKERSQQNDLNVPLKETEKHYHITQLAEGGKKREK